MSDLSRFGVSVEEELLESFDRLIAGQGYANRSEALRDLMRDAIIKSRLEDEDEAGESLGSLTLIYNHHAVELTEKMNEVQHERHDLIVSLLHVHINHDDCMEVIVLRGATKEIRALSDALLSLKGVKHGSLFITLTVREITRQKPNVRSQTHDHPH